ncbi:hypothetical protein QP166_06600 [Sphingomonas sp. LR60]
MAGLENGRAGEWLAHVGRARYVGEVKTMLTTTTTRPCPGAGARVIL